VSRDARTARPSPTRPAGLGAKVVRFLGSFGLASSLFLLLMLVVLIGTLQQRVMNVDEAQERYFESAWFVLDVFGVPMPFPGGMLLLAVLLVNLVVGGLLRLRWGRSTLGILVTHAGVVVLLVGSAIEYAASDKGHVALAEGRAADTFESYTDWELAIFDVAGSKEWVVPQEDLERAAGAGRLFVEEGLPFDVRVSGYARNSKLMAADHPGEGAEGVVVVPVPSDRKQAEANVPGAYVEVVATGATPSRGVVRGSALAPYTAEVLGATWAFELRRKSWRLPFRIELVEGGREDFPGTDNPSKYWSDVRVVSGESSRIAHISMNEPLRHEGHTFYQSTFVRLAEGSSRSGLAVVRNPTDRVPAIACFIIAIGMMVHFGTKLARYLTAQSKLRAAAVVARTT
jgi:hypothetical protein